MSKPKKSRPAAGSRKRPTGTSSPRQTAHKEPVSAQSRPTRPWGRLLWALVTAVVIAALLFEFTMLWTLGVGAYMLALGEFTGLWFLVGGYILACVPPAFGLIIATRRFWYSLTHALWIGVIYGLGGFLLLDRLLGAF